MYKYFIILLIAFVSSQSFGQQKLDWDLCLDIQYKWQYSIEYATWYEKPLFNNEIQKLDGKTVEVQGFIIPYDVVNNKYFISLYPNSSCFFCQQAGKETVIQLDLKNQETFEVDQVVTLKGRFKTEEKPFEMPYILKEAVVVKK